MSVRVAGVVFMLSFMAFTAGAAGLRPPERGVSYGGVAESVHLRRCAHRCVCPVRWGVNFWGNLRLFSPCDNRVITHLY